MTEIMEIRKKILKLAWPAILEMLLHTTVWMIDTAFVGRLGAVALSAVGLGGQMFFSAVFIFAAVGVGTTAVVSRNIGAKDSKKAAHVGAQSLLLAWFIGLIIFTLGQLTIEHILALVDITPVVRQETLKYMEVIIWAGLFMPPMVVCNAILRGSGNTKTPMVIAAIANLTNIILDAVLIFGLLGFPPLGVKGAAIAVLTGQILGCVVVHFLIFSGRTPLNIKIKHLTRIDGLQIKKILNISIPAVIEEMVNNGGHIVVTLMLAAMGTVPFAAQQVAVATESLSFMPGYGFAIAATTLVGQSLGAGDEKMARMITVEAAKMSMMVMGGAAILFLTIPGYLTRLFTDDINVVNLAMICIRIGAFEQLFIAGSMVIAGSLRGAGDTRWALFSTAFGFWFVRLPLVYLSVYHWHLPIYYIWIITLLDWAVRCSVLAYRFKGSRWTKIQVN